MKPILDLAHTQAFQPTHAQLKNGFTNLHGKDIIIPINSQDTKTFQTHHIAHYIPVLGLLRKTNLLHPNPTILISINHNSKNNTTTKDLIHYQQITRYIESFLHHFAKYSFKQVLTIYTLNHVTHSGKTLTNIIKSIQHKPTQDFIQNHKTESLITILNNIPVFPKHYNPLQNDTGYVVLHNQNYIPYYKHQKYIQETLKTLQHTLYEDPIYISESTVVFPQTKTSWQNQDIINCYLSNKKYQAFINKYQSILFNTDQNSQTE